MAMYEKVVPALVASPIAKEVGRYLKETRGQFQKNTPEYFMRMALGGALEAHKRGNYAIGATSVVFDENNAAVFVGRNHMFTGTSFERTHMHAETDSLRRTFGRSNPVEVLERGVVDPLLESVGNLQQTKGGIIVFGSLEPCDKCTVEITHAAPLIQERFGPTGKVISISGHIDGKVELNAGVPRSSGAAKALGAKSLLNDAVWAGIRTSFKDGNTDPPVRFSLLGTDKTQLEPGVFNYNVKPWEFIQTTDPELTRLCADIFEQGRTELDNALGGNKS